MNRIDAQYTSTPFYGSRRMAAHLRAAGVMINRKRVQRLMRQMGLAGMAPGPNTSKPHPQHRVYPYLLRGLVIERPGQVWSTDVTYVRLRQGFVYLVAILDWYSRKVLSWSLPGSAVLREGEERGVRFFGRRAGGGTNRVAAAGLGVLPGWRH